MSIFVFFFNDPATTQIYTLSRHDALPIWTFRPRSGDVRFPPDDVVERDFAAMAANGINAVRTYTRPPRLLLDAARSEEHTSELQSRQYLVCRLLLEKKKKSISIRVLNNNE